METPLQGGCACGEVRYALRTVSTLDDPEAVEPGFHIFRASRIGWFETADELPRHERFRPRTRGLGGTEPPG